MENNINNLIPITKTKDYTLLDLKKIQNFSFNNENKENILTEIYDDRTKLLKFYLLGTNTQVLIFKIENSENLILSQNLKFNLKLENEKVFAFTVYLNRIFIINSTISIYMIDLERKQLHNIEVEEEGNLELCDNHSYIFIDTKIIFTGGINKKGVLNNSVTSFDISLYKFNEEKVRENNLIPRHSHGSIAMSDIIYIIGGFTTVEESRENICKKIQAIKFDNLMNTWLEVKVEGDQPDLLIKPQISINSQNMVVFSDYLYPKFYVLKNSTSKGKMINLSKLEIIKQPGSNSIFSFVNKTTKTAPTSEEECNIIYINKQSELCGLNFLFNF